MARVEDMTVRLKVVDEVSPRLRRLRFGFWLAARPNVVIAVAMTLTGLLGFASGVALVLWAVR